MLKVLERNGIDAVFDLFGIDHFKRSIKTLSKRGKLVAYGAYGANSGLDLIKSFLTVQLWNLTPWKPSTAFYSIGSWHKKHFEWFEHDLNHLFGLLSAGKLRPNIGKHIKLEEAAEAHQLIEKGGVKGKMIILMEH